MFGQNQLCSAAGLVTTAYTRWRQCSPSPAQTTLLSSWADPGRVLGLNWPVWRRVAVDCSHLIM